MIKYLGSYWFGFDETGVDSIDSVLSAICLAGKGYHSTEFWNEDNKEDYEQFRGKSYIEWIQNSANDAAKEIQSLTQQLATKDKIIEELKKGLGFYGDIHHYTINDYDDRFGIVGCEEDYSDVSYREKDGLMYRDSFAGKLARQTLAKVKEMEGK